MILTGERDRLARNMLEALMAGNAHRAHDVSREAFDHGLDLVDLFDHILAPSLCVVGERWQEGLVRHTQERFATTAAEALLDRLSPAPAIADGPEWIVATMSGDDHRVGARMASASLGQAGLPVRTLLNQHQAELIAAAEGAAGVCLSCSGPWTAVPARAAATAIAATGTPVFLGGGGWAGWEDPPLIRQVGSMRELAAEAARQSAIA